MPTCAAIRNTSIVRIVVFYTYTRRFVTMAHAVSNARSAAGTLVVWLKQAASRRTVDRSSGGGIGGAMQGDQAVIVEPSSRS